MPGVGALYVWIARMCDAIGEFVLSLSSNYRLAVP